MSATKTMTNRMQTNTAVSALDLMSYIEGCEPVTGQYRLVSEWRGKEYTTDVQWNPARATTEELEDFVFGSFVRYEKKTVHQVLYLLVNDEGRLLARRGGRDFWTLPPWQRDRLRLENGVRDWRLNLEPIARKTERAMRQHQERVGGRVVKMTFGVHTHCAPLEVVFLD